MSAKPKKLRVETVKKTVKGKVYTSVLLRCSFRQDGKVKHKSVGNLTGLPPDVIDFVKRRLSGELDANAPSPSSFEIVRSLPHGNVMAVLQTARQLGLENLLASRSCRERDLIMALCDSEGRPIAIEVFPGNTADPHTFTQIVARVRKRFGINRIVFVGDRGMITSARINDDLRGVEGLDWISALRNGGIRKLCEAGAIQMSLFDKQDLAEVISEHYPDERLVVCRNPALAEQRARKREELLKATEAKLEPIRIATLRTHHPLRGAVQIGLRVGKVIGKYRMAKHFDLTITETSFTYTRNHDKIRDEAALDGLYVIRSSVDRKRMSSERVVETYKSLAKVERAFRCLKTVDLSLRPLYHRNDDRIRSHVFICMLAYYVDWHMREKLRPVLFADDDRESAAEARASIVAPAQRSESAKHKDATRRTADDFPVQGFHDILADLGTLCRNRIRISEYDAEFDKLTLATPYQQHVLNLLGVAT